MLRGAAGGVAAHLLPLSAAGLVGLGQGTAWADAEDPTMRRRRREAIRKGCAYIASKQHQKAGGFGDNNGIVAITSLSLLALMADGSMDGRGRYGEVVYRGIDFLLELIEDRGRRGGWHEGYFYHPQDPSSRMHGQGYATMALATAIGNSTGRRYRRMHDVLQKAVACIEQSQTVTGGFGYDPTPSGEHEGSVTVTVAQGLRASRDAGLSVNERVIRRGLHYLKRSQKADGSFKYSLHLERSSYALTAAAISSFFLYGRYTDDRDRTIQRGLDFCMKSMNEVLRTRRWYYYGNFYAAWACWQKDGGVWNADARGYWARWYDRMVPDILRKQRRLGNWEDTIDQFEFKEILPTAFAVLTLAIPDEVLPLFQR